MRSMIPIGLVALLAGCEKSAHARQETETEPREVAPVTRADSPASVGLGAAGEMPAEPGADTEIEDQLRAERAMARRLARIRNRIAVVDRKVGKAALYLPTFEGTARRELQDLLDDIEARRSKLQRDVAALRPIDDDLDRLELDAERAVVKAMAPGTP